MLIMNQNCDSLIDTTGNMIRIDKILGSEGSLCYRVSGYAGGMRVTISEHEDLEEAKKALMAIQYGVRRAVPTFCFDDYVVNNLDAVIKAFTR